MAFKFGNINFPPGKKKDEAKEFVPAERPMPLAAGVLHESPEDLKRHLEEYVDAMNEYATQHDVFISNEKKALNDAKGELVGLSEVLTKTENPHEQKNLEGQMSELLEKINGTLTKALNDEIAEFESKREKVHQEAGVAGEPLELTEEYELPPDPTHLEIKQGLHTKVQKVVSLEEARAKSASEESEPEAVATASERNPKSPEERALEREQKADKFAEKFGLSEARQTLHDAEEAYKTALQSARTNIWPLKGDATRAAEEAYLDAQIAWRVALDEATQKADKNDKITARFIGIRDTSLRPEALRQEAARAKLEEKEGKLGTRIGKWMKLPVIGLLNAYKESTAFYGDKAAGAHQLLFKKRETLDENELALDRKKLAERYTRSVRIVGGAIVASAVTGGWAGLGLPLLLRAARGFTSAGLGAVAGGAAGKIYEKTVNASRQQELLDVLKDIEGGIGITDRDALIAEKKTYARGNAMARAKGRRFAEAGATLAVAGTTSLATGAAVSHYQHLEAVQKAAKTISENAASGPSPLPTTTPGGITTSNSIPSGAPAPESVAAGVSVPSSPESIVAHATISHQGEGTGVLFEHLKAVIRGNGSFATNQSAGLRHFLETNPNVLSREVGKAFGENGMRMHMGDQFVVDNHENIWFKPASGKPQLFVENSGKIHPLTETLRPSAAHAHVAPRVVPEPAHAPAVSHAEPATPVSPRQPESVPVTPAPAPTYESAAAVPAAPSEAPSASPSPEAIPMPKAPLQSPSIQPESVVPPPAPQPEAMPDVPPQAPAAPAAPAAPIEAPKASIDSVPQVSSVASESIFTNLHGLQIDRTTPSAYAFDLPDGKTGISIFGGTNAERLKAVQDYLHENPNSTVRFTDMITDLETNKQYPFTLEWSSNEAGIPLITTPPIPGEESTFPPIDPQQFTRKLDFTFEKQ